MGLMYFFIYCLCTGAKLERRLHCALCTQAAILTLTVTRSRHTPHCPAAACREKGRGAMGPREHTEQLD